MATRNQMSLVVLKLQLLEDELGKLYQGVELYCSDVINKGADSIRSRVKQEEAIDEFRLAYDTALNFMKKNIMEMEKFTKVPEITQRLKKNGPADTPMFKVISNLQTLRYLKQQFQEMIANLLAEMLQLGNRFLTHQSSGNPAQGFQGANPNTRRGSHTAPIVNVAFATSDNPTAGIGARRASIDTPRHANSKPNLDKRRASYDVHRQNPGLQRWRNEVENAIPESHPAGQDAEVPKSTAARQNQDAQRPISEFPRKSFAEVSRQLEACLVFVMEKRLEIGETDRNEFSDILSLFDGERLSKFMPAKPQLPFSMVSKQDHLIDKLIERIDLLERQISDKSSDLICLEAAVDPLVTDVNEVKSKCEDLEDVATVQYEAVAHLNETVTSMNRDLVDLQQRFESFLRIFAASRSETTKQYVNFDRRMSDVEKTKDGLGKFSGGEKSHQSPVPHQSAPVKGSTVEGRSPIDEADGADEVFDSDKKKTVKFTDMDPETQTDVASDPDRDLSKLRKRKDTYLAGFKEESRKNGMEVGEQIKEIEAKLLAMQKSKRDTVHKASTLFTNGNFGKSSPYELTSNV
ncbi:unnamed protein product [Lymnaea stagnalis]|uniref:Uncharacterized protein n=1 Tax=Lymnaea stagnalis TaxID=6523 RepID=A0AAV2H6T9_LYMST